MMLFLFVLLFYGLTVLGFYFLQERILFQGTPLSQSHQFQFDNSFEELWLEDTINGLFFNAEDTSKGIVVYFHGNADNLQRWGNYAIDITSLGYDVLMIDYPSYGKSKGKPSEKALYQCGEMAYQWAIERYDTANIIIYGRSLGTGVASYLASEVVAQQLILETPFYSIPEVIQTSYPFLWQPFSLKNEFPNYANLPRVKYPITIFQGTADRVVPYASAIKLHSFLKSTDRFITIEGGRHKDLSNFNVFHKVLKELLQ